MHNKNYISAGCINTAKNNKTNSNEKTKMFRGHLTVLHENIF